MKKMRFIKIFVEVICVVWLLPALVFADDNVFPANGNVGVGTVSPSADYGSDTILEISGTTCPGLVINDTGQSSKYGLMTNSNDLKITYGTNILAVFQNDGLVGIGTPYPLDLLHIKADSSAGSGVLPILRLENYIPEGITGDGQAIQFFNGWASGSNPRAGIEMRYKNDTVNRTSLVFRTRHNSVYHESMTIDHTGYVGIGTTEPQSCLQIGENAAKPSDLRFKSLSSNVRIGVSGGDSDFWIRDDNTQTFRFYISSNGNVGIGGTTTPEHTLEVIGTIAAKEVKVTTAISANEYKVNDAQWSDFVFEDGYKLPSLDQVENYIKENKHLPDVPSAEQIAQDGLSMSEMMAKQMQKIEELTLYVIELKKENEELKKNSDQEISKLRAEIQSLAKGR